MKTKPLRVTYVDILIEWLCDLPRRLRMTVYGSMAFPNRSARAAWQLSKRKL